MASTQPGGEVLGTGSQALDVLLARVEDAALRAELAAEIAPLRAEQSLGLVFERHLPETARLYGHPVRRGLTVTERQDGGDGALWRVAKVKGGDALLRRQGDDGSTVEVSRPVQDLVVVREFGTPIYPGLRSEGRVNRGGDSPWHTVINAENHHALEALLYACAGQVDVIYIDPPYNTGKEFVYNDKLVGADDGYRHSKWLSFMEKRLLLARRLLKDTGVIFISIDDHEQAHLKLLCDQIFGEQNFIATAVWQKKYGGGNDAAHIATEHEYVLVFGREKTQVPAFIVPHTEKYLKRYKEQDSTGKFFWDTLARPGLTGAINITLDDGKGAVSVRCGISQQTAESLFERGDLRVVRRPGRPPSVQFKQRLAGGKRMRSLIQMSGAEVGGTSAGKADLREVLASDVFSYPKPTALLEHLLRASSVPLDALVLDFFAGSGTTAHAVMKLNAEDGGTRRCISVTNNEVNPTTSKALTKAGHRPGDDAWEAEGVFRRVTRPRLEAAVTGLRPDGTEHKQGTLDANVEFFTLTYEDPDTVKLGAAFEAVAPLLWLKAGAQGPRIDAADEPWSLPDGARYGILFNTDHWADFTTAVNTAADNGQPPVMVFIVSGSDAVFQQVASELPPETEPVRLYDDYLTNFTINTGTAR